MVQYLSTLKLNGKKDKTSKVETLHQKINENVHWNITHFSIGSKIIVTQ